MNNIINHRRAVQLIQFCNVVKIKTMPQIKKNKALTNVNYILKILATNNIKTKSLRNYPATTNKLTH